MTPRPFHKGDRVIYIDDTRYGDSRNNPLWGGRYGKTIGTVTGCDSHQWTRVAWDNGGCNGYNPKYLKIYKNPIQNILDDELFTL